MTGHREQLAKLEDRIWAWQWKKKRLAQQILRQGAIVGYRATNQTLEEAVTKTGLEREEHGGHPGRVRSGQLTSDLGFYVSPSVDAAEGAWFGWPVEQESYEYAAAQDMGRYGGKFVDEEVGYVGGREASPYIPPAGALWEGALRARETIRELLEMAGFKRGSIG